MSAPPCWICGNQADTAEHMAKASDVRSLFGRITQGAPVFRHSKLARNEAVPSVKSQKLKFAPSLCGYCNNTRTQPHDRAWEALSKAVLSGQVPFAPRTTLQLARVFGPESRSQLLNVHLYFLKLLGCYAVEYHVPLPTNHFALCICNGVAHPSVYISLVCVASNAEKQALIVGNIEAVNLGERIVAASWFYVVGILGIHVTYLESGHPSPHHLRRWHPSDLSLGLHIH